MKIGNREFDTQNKTYIMGILNVTPDSFSDGGRYNHLDQALNHAQEMIRQGADIIDIGGESTRPGHTVITDQEEIERVVPVLKALKSRFDIPLSIDTYKSTVAEQALAAGADLINDIWGFKHDPGMAPLAARTGAACCLMHNREDQDYGNFVEDVLKDLDESIRLGKEAGVRDDRLILDPGVGFAKTVEGNLKIINHLERLRELGYPVLLGTSRKSVIGAVLDLPVQERLEGTLVTTVFGVLKGCAFVRVHDVQANRRAIQMAEAILERT